MGFVYVCSEEYSDWVEYPKEEFGSWAKDTSFIINGVYLKKKKFCDAFEVDEEVNVGDLVFVVYGLYDSGDSFGWETGKGEVIGVFKSREKAEKFAKMVEVYNELQNIGDRFFLNPKEKKELMEKLEKDLSGFIDEDERFCWEEKSMWFPWGGMFDILKEVVVKEEVVR